MDRTIDLEKLKAEFEQIRELSGDGLVHPEVAETWARQNKESELHKKLEWDDSTAGQLYRHQQIRQLVRVIVRAGDDGHKQIRAFVSLPSDRVNGGGYRTTDDAMLRARNEMVNEALNVIRRQRRRFTHLPELTSLFDAIDLEVAKYVAATTASKAG